MSIVILAPNWLGDAVMALPAIRDVRRHFSGQPLSVAARPSIAPVFRAVPGIDRIIVLERRKGIVAASRQTSASCFPIRFDRRGS